MKEKNEFLNPDYIYIPLGKINKKKIEDSIYFEELVSAFDNKKYIYSPVSGIVSKISEMNYSYGKMPSLMIENDFKDKRKKTFPSYNSIYSMTKDEISELLKAFNIEFGKTINVKVVYKKNVSADSCLFEDVIEEILELLDVLNTSFKKAVNLCVKSNDMHANYAISKYKESYPNIKVIYDNDKLDNYVSVFDIYNAYLILKSKRLLTYKYVSLIQNNVQYIVKVKLYTLVKDVIKFLNIKEANNISLLNSDLIEIKNENNVIDENILCIIVK